MKKFCINFLKRGCAWAWGGPAILCIVWACLKYAGAIETVEVTAAISGVVSTTLVAFIAAGVSIVYQMEQLPKGIAALIQMLVLYISYLVMYLFNGWMPTKVVGIFTVIFVGVFAVVWAIIYLTVKNSVKKMNARLEK